MQRGWEALTSAAFTHAYWAGRHIVSTWKPGASVQLLNPDGSVDWEGEVVTVTPPRVLSYTFEAPRVELGATEPPSRVMFDIQPEGAGARLSLIHDGFAPGSKTHDRVSDGWPGILSNLKSLLETGKAVDSPQWRAA